MSTGTGVLSVEGTGVRAVGQPRKSPISQTKAPATIETGILATRGAAVVDLLTNALFTSNHSAGKHQAKMLSCKQGQWNAPKIS